MTQESLGHLYDESENNLQIFDNKYYSFTINLSTKKYIGNKQWCKYDHEEQERIIYLSLKDAIKRLCLPDFDYYFELTKIGNAHLHGCIYTNYVGMLMLQEEIHKSLGLPRVHPSIVFYFEETIKDIDHWRAYMHKTDPNYHPNTPDIDFI